MKKFFIGAGDCPRRNIDTQRIYNYLIKNNWTNTDKISSADLIVVSTCAYCKRTETISLNSIKNIYKKKSKSAKVIIAGCLPKINPEILEEFSNFYTVTPKELDKLDSLLASKIEFKDIPDPNTYSLRNLLLEESFLKKVFYRFSLNRDFLNVCLNKIKRILKNEKIDIAYGSMFNLKIVSGCLSQCSFCAIKFSTGKLKSKAKDLIINEFKNGLEKGYKNFVLQGEDVGAYGLDIKTNIVDLLESILAFDGDYKLIINDFNAQWLVKYFNDLLPLFKKHSQKIEYIRIPIQSGSNRILKLMKRPYYIENVKEKILKIKEEIPNFIINTHIMVGFPGETEEDFKKSVKLLEELNFNEIGLFLYEDRPRIEAANLDNKVPWKTIVRRAFIIRNKFKIA